jgi:RNA polymerase sigma-70 factor (ECF subfamily)
VNAAARPPDAELLRLAQAGDEAAFTSLALAWHPQIHRWAAGLVADADDADDVAQTVLVRLFEHLPGFRGTARLSTWLYQITRNAALDALRKRRRRQRLLERWRGAEGVQNAQTQPGATLDRQDLLDRAREVVAGLPERQRAVLALVDLQGHAAQEAAALLGVAPSTARVHLLRARRAVRAALMADLPAPEEHEKGAG